MDRLTLFEKYRNFEFVNTTELDLIVDYICENLNSIGTNYPYWYDMYCYTSKTRIVLRLKEKKNQVTVAKFGECACKNEVVNFLKNNHQCNCDEGCASVYFNAVF